MRNNRFTAKQIKLTINTIKHIQTNILHSKFIEFNICKLICIQITFIYSSFALERVHKCVRISTAPLEKPLRNTCHRDPCVRNVVTELISATSHSGSSGRASRSVKLMYSAWAR